MSTELIGEDPMCPACLASAAMMAGSVVSSGGLTALLVKLLCWKNWDRKSKT